MMIKCYTPAAIANTSPSGCTDINTYFPDPEKQAIAPFLYAWRSHAYTEHGCGSRCTYCYGISTRFHHVDADMGHSIQRAERVHLSSVLAPLGVKGPPPLRKRNRGLKADRLHGDDCLLGY